MAPKLSRQDSAFGMGAVWVQDAVHGYLPAHATASGKADIANVSVPDSVTKKRAAPIDIKTAPHSAIVMRSIDDLESTVADLADLQDLSEPALMHNLFERYCNDSIYTLCGGIICSLNPYKRLPRSYGDAQMAKYRQAAAVGNVTDLPPHVYGLTQLAYKDMIDGGGDQALIMSGESGAGKTEACKLAMGYLVAASAAGGDGDGETVSVSSSVAKRVADCIINSNHVLESFGNAKTFRNDNSSRFGKWLALSFTITGVACGGSITTYLLESVRVTKQMKAERNYHCFYQLLTAAASGAEYNSLGGDIKKAWFLGEAKNFHYLNQSGCVKIDGVNDGEDFATLVKQLRGMRVPEDTLKRLFRLLAALLHLGDINFAEEKARGNEGSRVKQEAIAKGAKESRLQVVAQLLEVAPQALTQALSSRVLSTGRGSSYTVPLKVAEAEDTRDALATSIYAAIFGWIVTQVNHALVDAVQEQANTVSDDEDEDDDSGDSGDDEKSEGAKATGGAAAAAAAAAATATPRGRDPSTPGGANGDRRSTFLEIIKQADDDAKRQGLTNLRSTIGILDIFGFEDLEINSFEQLCINYTNEKLQAHFTEAIFRETQAEYRAEGIDVAVIGFRDNDAQVALVDKRPLGLLSLLEEECFVPKGSDAGFLNKIDEHFGAGKSPFFTRPKLRQKDMEDAFCIRHYAGDVTYRTRGWLDKSRGMLRPDLYRLVQTSDCPLLSALPWLNEAQAAAAAAEASQGRAAKGKATRTVGTQFVAELRELVGLLGSMNSRFLRCLKPNMRKLPDCFDGAAVLRQLRYTGMLECVHIRRAGFPVTVPHEQMLARMRPLINIVLGRMDASDDIRAAEAASPIEAVRRLLALEVMAAADNLPRLSAERQSHAQGMAPFAVGKTKLFMREFLYQHVMHKRDELRDDAVRRIQRRAKKRGAIRIAARRRLKELMVDGNADALRRVIAVARRVGVPGTLIKQAERIETELRAAMAHAAALEAAEAAEDPAQLEAALAQAHAWYEARPSEGAQTILSKERVEAMQEKLDEYRGKALLRDLEAAVEARAPPAMQASLQRCREWVAERERAERASVRASGRGSVAFASGRGSVVEGATRVSFRGDVSGRASRRTVPESPRTPGMGAAAAAAPPPGGLARLELPASGRATGVEPESPRVPPSPRASRYAQLIGQLRGACERGDALLKELIGKKEATAELEAILAKGLKADAQQLAASLATAELVGVDEELVGQARVLVRDIAEAASAEAMEQARLKREAEAAKEEELRAARHAALAERRDAKLTEIGRREDRRRQLEDDEDDELLKAAGGELGKGVLGGGDGATAESADDLQYLVGKKVGRDAVTTATTLHQMMLEHRVDKSGWLLKTGHTTGTGNWKPHKWSSRFFVMMGGTLYYFRPQAMAQAAGCIELSDSVQVCAGVSLRSPPSGSFTLTLPPVSRGDKVGKKQDYPLSAGSDREMHAWMRAIVAARGKPAHALPDETVLHQLASFTGNVAADGGSSFAVRIQKHIAEKYATSHDLEQLLGRAPGTSQMLRASLGAMQHVHGEEAALELKQRCTVLAAKLAVLLRCKLLEPAELSQTGSALKHAVELAMQKRGRVQPTGPSAMRLLPGAVAVDTTDPFHTGLGGAMGSVGMALSKAIASHMSESSCASMQDVFAQLGSQEVLIALYGNALKPFSGIGCREMLDELMAACQLFLEPPPERELVKERAASIFGGGRSARTATKAAGGDTGTLNTPS